MNRRTGLIIVVAACGLILRSPMVNGAVDKAVTAVRNIPDQSGVSLKVEAILKSHGVTIHSGKSLVILRGHDLAANPLPEGNQYYPPRWNDAIFLVQPSIDGKVHVIFSAIGTGDPNTGIEPHPDHKKFGGWARIKSGWYPDNWVSDGSLILQAKAIEVEVIDQKGTPSRSMFWDNGTPEEPGSFIAHPPMIFNNPPAVGEAVSSQGCIVLKRNGDWAKLMDLIGENKVVPIGIW